MNLSAIDLNLLLVLQVVLEERSVTRAAKKLHVTPPAVSNALARLRSALQDPLLVRSGRGLSPTPRAAEVLPLLRNAMGALEQVVERGASFDPAIAKRTFRLACSDADQISLVPAVAHRFAKVLPNSTLEVLSIDQLEAMGGVDRAEVDASIVPAFPGDAAPFAAFLYGDEGVIAVRRNHPAARRRLTKERFNTLRHVDLRIALGARGLGNRMAEDAFVRAGLVRQIVMTVPTFSAALMIAATTDLAAGVPLRVGRAYQSMMPLALLTAPGVQLRFTMQLQWQERTDCDPGSRFFRELVLDVAHGAEREGPRR